MKIALTLVATVLAGVPAWAQRLEVTPLASYTTAASIEQTTRGVDSLDVTSGMTWGVQGAYFLSEHFGVEGTWTYQSTAVQIASGSVSTDLFSMTANQLHGSLVYQFGPSERAWKPFVFGGLGATFLSGSDLESDTRPSWTVGGGLKWFVQRHVGLKLQARYKPTELNDSDESGCGPFGFCQGSLQNSEIAAGAVFRF